MDLIVKSKQFAHDAHDSVGQVRKYSGEPYWKHTDEVAGIVQALPVGYIPNADKLVAAAHLHDILEDVTPLKPETYSYAAIEFEFGKEIAKIVHELTDEYIKESYPNLNRAERKQLERERLGKASYEAKTIKLADLISNTRDILAQDKKFAVIYLKEKAALLPYLKGGDEELWNRANEQVIAGMEELGIN